MVIIYWRVREFINIGWSFLLLYHLTFYMLFHYHYQCFPDMFYQRWSCRMRSCPNQVSHKLNGLVQRSFSWYMPTSHLAKRKRQVQIMWCLFSILYMRKLCCVFIKFDNAEILNLYLLHGFTCYFQTSFKKNWKI